MESFKRTLLITLVVFWSARTCDSAKINTPRVLLPWFENLTVNFTFEIIEGGCYTWSLSRDDIIDLVPIYEDSWGHCSRAARVSVSKTCVPPGSVIILAEEVNSGEILRGDVDVDKISSLKVMSTTWKLYLEQAPEAFEVFAYDDLGNKFSTLEGVSFTWTFANLGSNVGEDPLVDLIRWSDTDYEAPRGIAELESLGARSHSVLLHGLAMGECRVTVCLKNICTDFDLNVVASVVLTPAMAVIAPGDTLRYRVVRARAGRLTIQDIAETLYYMKIPSTDVAVLEDAISLVRGTEIGTTTIQLMSGANEVATATLTVAEPHSIRVSIRPANLVMQYEPFVVHCVVLDVHGHPLTAGDQLLVRLTVNGQANVDLLRSTENGTITDAVAQNAGGFTVTAKLYSIAGRTISKKVEGKASAVAVEPLEVVPPELYVAWTDTFQEIQMQHVGGGSEPVVWSEAEGGGGALALAAGGLLAVRGAGDLAARVQLLNYPHVRAGGKVLSAAPELVQVSSSGRARVGKPHQLHVALTASHPTTGEYYNFHICNCASFAVSLLEGPEPHNVTAAPWVQPAEGACCVIECAWSARGVSSLRVSRGRAGDAARVAVRAQPRLVWPPRLAALVGAHLPVLAEGEALVPQSSDPRVAELRAREPPPPARHPHLQLFTVTCRRKGDSRLELVADDEEREAAELEAACAPHVTRVRLEPAAAPGNCSSAPRIWLRPGHEVVIRVTLYDAAGRELLDERGPRVSWEVEPKHPGIEFRAVDRLFVETDPEYAPVPVPSKYYQLVVADEQAVGWSGTIKASIPDAVASIQARVVAPLKIEPLKVNIAWEGESVASIASVSRGSGRYAVAAPKGSSGSVDGGRLAAVVPGPGAYDLHVTDQCVHGDKQRVELLIEEVVSVEVSTSRAVCVGACVPVAAAVRGASLARLQTARAPAWRPSAHLAVADGLLCGLSEGAGKLRATFGGVSSSDVEVLVFPPLGVVPARARLPPGGRLQLRHEGGPPAHLAAMLYALPAGSGTSLEVSSSGLVQALSPGASRVRLVARDIADVEMASAEAEIEVIPITGLRVRAATQTLLVGSPAPLWLEASGLGAGALAALAPAPRVAWAVREPRAARLHTTHVDDKLERSVAEGVSVRVIPLKPGVITIDVRVRNMGQIAESRSWDSTIEILAVSDIQVSVQGLPQPMTSGDRLSVAVGSTIRLNSLPRSTYQAFGEGFEVSPGGELKALSPGYGVVIAQHKDERNNIYRETITHVEVSVPAYCTAEPGGAEDGAVRLVVRGAQGRALLAPGAAAAAAPVAHTPSQDSALGPELLLAGLDSVGGFMSFQATAGGVTVKDEVWVTGSDSHADKIIVTGAWGVCLDGVGWSAPPEVAVYPGSHASLSVLTQMGANKHSLRRDRPSASKTLVQLPVDKMDFVQGEWPYTMVPLSIEATGLTGGPLLCSEEQKYALEGIEVKLPYTCRAKAPHSAKPVLDILNGQLGCSVVPAAPITESSEIELCAEWSGLRTCTRVLLVPPIRLSNPKISLLEPPATFTIYGDSHVLKSVRLTPSPGLKIEQHSSADELKVTVTSEVSVCGFGWVGVVSRLTAQELRVEVERECEIACGTLLGALFTLVRPYVPTIFTVAAVVVAYMYIQHRWGRKASIRLPEAPQSVIPPASPEPFARRSWSRSPYTPVYGDADQSLSPNTTRMHSRFL